MFLACSDCIVEWGEWSECLPRRRRIKSQYIVQPSTGGGAECPILEQQEEGKHCMK